MSLVYFVCTTHYIISRELVRNGKIIYCFHTTILVCWRHTLLSGAGCFQMEPVRLHMVVVVEWHQTQSENAVASCVCSAHGYLEMSDYNVRNEHKFFAAFVLYS